MSVHLNAWINPSVVVEVLSRSTAEDSAGEKLQRYLRIPSRQHAVVVSFDAPRITVFGGDEVGSSRKLVLAPSRSCTVSIANFTSTRFTVAL